MDRDVSREVLYVQHIANSGCMRIQEHILLLYNSKWTAGYLRITRGV